MSKKPKLKVITTPEECCKRSLACDCQHDKTSRDDSKCIWWLNSKDHGYCFWKYMRDKSGPDGVMKELVQSELAELFGYSNTKTHFVLKQAIEELKAALVINGALEMLDGQDDDIEAWDSTLVDLDFDGVNGEPE